MIEMASNNGGDEKGKAADSAAKGPGPLGRILAVAAITVVVMGVSAAIIMPMLKGDDTEVAQESAAPEKTQAEAPALKAGESEAGESENTVGETESGHAVIQLETDSYDMGIIAGDKIAKQQMKIFNRGSKPLQITQVKTSCGCTKGRMLEKTIKPGEEGILEITVDPARITNGFSSTKVLTIFSNDPDKATVQVKVHAQVEPEFTIVPDTLDFGTVEQGATAERTLLITQMQDAPFEITKVTVPGNAGGLETNLEEVPESQWATPGHREYRLTAKITKEATSALLTKRIVLDTNLKRLKRMSVPLKFDIKGAYTLNPKTIYLKSVDPGQNVPEVLRITADEPIQITAFESKNPAIKTKHRTGENPNTILFDVAIDPEPRVRLLRDTWTLKIQVGDEHFTESVRVLAVISPEAASAKGLPNPAIPPNRRKAAVRKVKMLQEKPTKP